MNWSLYIIRCADNSLYTGITTDVARRFAQHASGRGAKYFRGHVPQKVVYVEHGLTHQAAAQREYQIKQLSHAAKEKLINLSLGQEIILHIK